MAKKQVKADGDKLVVSANGHVLNGLRVGGRWRFHCESWPELATSFANTESAEVAIRTFIGRAMEGSLDLSK